MAHQESRTRQERELRRNFSRIQCVVCGLLGQDYNSNTTFISGIIVENDQTTWEFLTDIKVVIIHSILSSGRILT
ncbi:cannabinoid receptor 1 isoform X2 [Engystomops pustulosus]|uniref:cannabinoid receptor 1 isoform X2 n=1 Tax=Engystomops pustulosus TaxID=76066 RepID=UPI003AFB407D